MTTRRSSSAGPDPIRNDRRRAKREHNFPPGTACIHCGNSENIVLVKPGRHLIEGHHTDGATNDNELVAPECLNCHAIDTEAQRVAGIDLSHRPRSVLEQLAAGLRSRAAFHRSLAEAHERDGEQLAALALRLDDLCPQWRELPEAER
jgi:hypothetical protein